MRIAAVTVVIFYGSALAGCVTASSDPSPGIQSAVDAHLACVRGRARRMAISSREAADLVAVAAAEGCSVELQHLIDTQSATIPAPAATRIVLSMRPEWQRAALETVVEARATAGR